VTPGVPAAPRARRLVRAALMCAALGSAMPGAAARAQDAGGAQDPTIQAPPTPTTTTTPPTVTPPATTAATPAPIAARATAPPGASATPASPRLAPIPTAPADLRHVDAWVGYRTARHLASLPIEARVFYRRGLMAHQAGQVDEALANVRGAAELDPTFLEPHLTIASWMLTRDPSQALQQYAIVVELLRQNFNLQYELAANGFLVLVRALFAGLLFAGMILVWLRRAELTHGWRESLSQFATSRGAPYWALGMILLPYFAGFGFTLPTLVFLGALWPYLRTRERAVFVMLLASVLATPFVLNTVERMSLPLHDDASPYYSVPRIENASYDAAREERLAMVARREPDNAIVHFGLGWTARRGGHLDVAERAYRRALDLWPSDDRVWTDYANVLAIEGRTDDALKAYEKAIAANPANAAAYFNSAQLYTQRFDYQAATQALSRASALNFELVRTYQAQATTDGLLPLIDQWLAPRVFWRALARAGVPRDVRGTLPMSLRPYLEASGWGFSLAALVLSAAALAWGRWQHRQLPLRACSNCGQVVCRRCAERRREHALCPRCARVESLTEATDFSHVMLIRHRDEVQRRRHLVQTAFSSLLPGYGLLAYRRAITPVFLLAATWLLAEAWRGAAPPFALEPRLTLPGQDVPVVVIVSALLLVYTVSLLGYFGLTEQERRRQAALDSAQRGRITQASRRAPAAAA
jgi:tetratricopeptide (TPR) repeat protein